MAPAINMKIIFVTLCLVQSFTALETDGGVGFKKLLDKSDLELVEQFFIGTVKCWRYCIKDLLPGVQDDKIFTLLMESNKNYNRTDPNNFENPTSKVVANENSEKCKKFVMLGCDIPDMEVNNSKQDETLLTDRYPADKRATDKMKKIDIVEKAGLDDKLDDKLSVLDYDKFEMGKTKSQKLKTNKRETDYVSLNDKYDNTHIRFEDEAPNQGQPEEPEFVPETNVEPEFVPETNVEPEIETNEFNRSTLMKNFVEARQNEPLEVRDLQDNNIDSCFLKRHITVEVAPEAKLFVEPGSYTNSLENLHDIEFEITNTFPVTVYVRYQGISSNLRFLPPPPGLYLFPIAAGQKKRVSLVTRIPRNLNVEYEKVAIQVILSNEVVAQKSTYLYFRRNTNRFSDDYQPYIRYYFNNNCNGNLDSEYCSKTWWSVNVEVEDRQSGLKTVISTPSGIYSSAEYDAGSKALQRFYYTNTCCNPVVEVKAVDMYGNSRIRVIDVREWTNLSAGEVAAVVLGVFLLVILIALIVVSVLYCIHKKREMDLPYTSRYSSRPTQRTEGTNF